VKPRVYFHVGPSRGVVVLQPRVDSTFTIYSKNYTQCADYTNALLELAFIWNMADWDARWQSIKESRYIVWTLGQNLSKFTIT